MNNKTKKVIFYSACGLVLGVPYLVKLVMLIPELIAALPNFFEIFSCIGYTALIAGSLVLAYHFKFQTWVRIVATYGVVSLVITILSMIFGVLESFEVFTILFSLISAPYVGIHSPVAVMVLMMLITAGAYITLGQMPKEEKGKTDNTNG